MFEFIKPILHEAETAAKAGAPLEEILPVLRRLSLEDFGEFLFTMPDPEYPSLSAILPAMASIETQKQYNGKHGLPVLQRAAAFTRLAESICFRHTGTSLTGKRILDFGCGWGRFLRMMLYYTDPANLWGVDAWQNSIDLSQRAGVPANLARSEPAPSELPVEGRFFDFIFSYSIFTHLNKTGAEACLSALRKCIASDGLCVITIRPIEFWDMKNLPLDEQARASLKDRHHREGFAFLPRRNSTDTSYGHASMTFDYFRDTGWRFEGYDSITSDRFQIAAILRPGQTPETSG